MADLQTSLVGLRGLFQDLSALTQIPPTNLERLAVGLETHISAFRALLDKPAKNDTSRQKILSGKITIDNEEYSINEEFQQSALQLADALNIDELRAAAMFMAAQEDAEVLDRTPIIAAIMRYHESRSYLLECLRLVFYHSDSSYQENEEITDLMRRAGALILDIQPGSLHPASQFTRKCMEAMGDIAKYLSLIADQLQKASVIGDDVDHEVMEAIEFQRRSLLSQHESLGAIIFHLFKGTFTTAEDFRFLINQLKKQERFDALLIHYIPVTITAFVQYGSPEGSGNQEVARSLHSVITTAKDGNTYKLPSFQSAITALWLPIYSGWYLDENPSSIPGVDIEQEAADRTKMFMTALDDGALDFVLAICSAVNSEEWADPARTELVALLLRDSVVPLPELETCADSTKELLMENFEVFVEACIANMPDAVRKLKAEEDTQRLEQITALRDGLTSNLHRGLVEARTHLESLLLIIAFSFEHRQEAAQEFWVDTDSNLFGFLQWASKRQTVPRVSAFCEMLCSISTGEENATAAHRFLTEEEKFMSSKMRRSTTMSWTQMFAELHLYATRITEKSSSSTTAAQQGLMHARKPEPVDMTEPESPVMLTCYLRLMGHLCKQSDDIRTWMLQNESFNVVKTLLDLCSGMIPTHLRATIFATLSALMTDKDSTRGNEMWISLDQWLSTGTTPGLLGQITGGSTTASAKPSGSSGPSAGTMGIGKAPSQISNPALWHQQQLINTLVMSIPASELLINPLSIPFPSSLGGTYRMPGIEPYVDFILGHAMSRKLQDLNEQQSRFLTYHCLNFAAQSLGSFNENLVSVLSQQSPSDSADTTQALVTYVRLHSFARVMEWLFNEDVLKALFAASQQNIDEVAQASSDSVLVLTLIRSIEIMNLVMDLQSTYFNIVKPLVKNQGGNRTNVSNSTLACFEDSMLNNLSLVPKLCLYCGTGHQQLTIASLALLEKLTSSSKLNKMSSPEIIKWQSSNKIVEILANEIDVDSVSRALVNQMQPDEREFDWGADATGYVIREGILNLLDRCLGMITDRPTVAHLLLGFGCVGNVLDVPPQGLMANGRSLLQATIDFLQAWPVELNGSVVSWAIHLQRIAFSVLRHLWSSKLASYYTLAEMRSRLFLVNMLSRELIVGPNSPWDGFLVSDDGFWTSGAPSALSEFLLYRSHLFAYAATEIRSAAKVGSPTLQSEILSTLLGNSTVEGVSVTNPSVFDLFDIADLDVNFQYSGSQLNILRGIDIDLCAREEEESLTLYSMAEVEELIQIEKAKLAGSAPGSQLEEAFQIEADLLKAIVHATNQSRQIQHTRYLALRSWAELITTIITCSVIDETNKPTFILHAIQLILPKLEVAIDNDTPEALELGRLAETLISCLTSDISVTRASRSGDVIDEKLHQLFQVSTRGITLATGNVALREVLYSISSHYIARITSSNSTHETLRRHSQQIIKTAGPGLVEVICDDAYTGQEACRAAALLLLNCLAILDSRTDCILAELVSQSNYLSLFLDAIKSLPNELYGAKAGVLQQLCQTKSGATCVIKSGLFEAVRDSQLFATDPDIGIEMDNPDSLRRYYVLLLSVIRVIVSAVFSRGIHNEQIKAQTLSFIAENRTCMVGIFKRFAKIGGSAAADQQETLCELVKSFMALVTASGFVDFEEEERQQTTQPLIFS
ncbi:hypothetical protein N7470_008749 [Penicillium chermesinum]|nr:hypothetical protein N7470_008749 [Penicillium chermesinum]